MNSTEITPEIEKIAQRCMAFTFAGVMLFGVSITLVALNILPVISKLVLGLSMALVVIGQAGLIRNKLVYRFHIVVYKTYITPILVNLPMVIVFGILWFQALSWSA
jgi:hypothetical protein